MAASGGYRVPFCAGALLAVVSMGLARDLPTVAAPPAPDLERPPPRLVGGFVVLLLLYVGVENGVGGWEATSLRAALGLAHLPAVAPVAYTLTGLALGPVFPTMLAWLAAAAGGRGLTALVFAAANLGGVLLPAVIGQLVDAGSPAVIPTTVLVVVLACLSATLLLRRTAAFVP